MGRVAFLGIVVVVVAAACGGASLKPYTAARTAACLRHRPEAHKTSPGFSPLRIMQLNVTVERDDNGIYVKKRPHVPALFITFWPARTRAPHQFATAAFFPDREAASAYFRAVYQSAARLPYASPDLEVQQRRNAVLEWSFEGAQPGYLRIALNCLTP